MPYCPNCGLEVTASMNFCPACGAALAAGTELVPTETTAEPARTGTVADVETYRMILASRGNCSAFTLRKLLREVLGYTALQARTIMNNLPIEIARSMSLEQALRLSQLFTESGAQVAVAGDDGYVDLSSYASSSVYSGTGSLLSGIATILGTITAANRVDRLVRWNVDNYMRHLFTPRYAYLPRVTYTPPRPARPRYVQPKPVQPRPAQPKPAQPRPSQPGLFQSRPAQPKPSQPKPQQPGHGPSGSGNGNRPGGHGGFGHKPGGPGGGNKPGGPGGRR